MFLLLENLPSSVIFFFGTIMVKPEGRETFFFFFFLKFTVLDVMHCLTGREGRKRSNVTVFNWHKQHPQQLDHWPPATHHGIASADF